jgi:hypothetical protein
MTTSERPKAGGDTAEEELPPADDAGGNSPYRISRAAVVLIALALGLGLLIGRASVKTDTSTGPAAPTPGATRSSSVVPLGPKTLQQTGSLCSQQLGKTLVLAIEVRNTSSGPVIFKRMQVSLPLNGLKVLSKGTGSCGEFDAPKLEDLGLPPQGAVWLNVKLRPLEKCPAPYPVGLRLLVQDTTGQRQSINVTGFKDLGQVPWSGCR